MATLLLLLPLAQSLLVQPSLRQPLRAARAARPLRVPTILAQEGGAFDQEGGRERSRSAVIAKPKPKAKAKNKEDVEKEGSWSVLLHNDDVRAQPAGPPLTRGACYCTMTTCCTPCPATKCADTRSCPIPPGAHLRLRQHGHRASGPNDHAEEGPPHLRPGAQHGHRHRDDVVEAAGQAVLPQAAEVRPHLFDRARGWPIDSPLRWSWAAGIRGSCTFPGFPCSPLLYCRVSGARCVQRVSSFSMFDLN